MKTVEITEYGVLFKTGVPVTFRYVRNPEKSPFFGTTYQQDIEPAGRFMLHSRYPAPDNWEEGTITFRNPLVILLNENPDYQNSGRIYDDQSWKQKLSDHYGRKTGKALTQAIRADGYDGIVTVTPGIDNVPGDTREIVDLTIFDPKDEGFNGLRNVLLED